MVISRLHLSRSCSKSLFVALQMRMYSGSIPPAASSSQKTTLPFIAELYDPNFLDVLLPQSAKNTRPSVASAEVEPKNPLMEALRLNTAQTLTANGSPAYSSTGSATLDAFQALRRDTFGRAVDKNLDAAWKEDAELTLRIIWNLRSIHDGKSEKETFYRAFGWLYTKHPRTAIQNLHLLVDPVCTRRNATEGAPHGYWKDLLNIVALATVDQLEQMNGPATFLHSLRGLAPIVTITGEDASAATKVTGKSRRADVAAETHERLLIKLEDPKFRALFVAVTRLFSERLEKDVAVLKEIDALPPGSAPPSLYKQISLAGKWAPTPHSSHDRVTNISTAIISLLHHSRVTAPLPIPVRMDTPYTALETHVLRSYYQRWVLTALRRVSLVPEPLMTAQRWQEIRYGRVSSVCMNNNMGNFYAHDPEGFEKYLTAVEDGKKKISGATLLPHVLVQQAIELVTPPREPILERSGRRQEKPTVAELKRKIEKTRARVVEAQWSTMIERLRESGTLDNSIAICDVSGSMGSLNSSPKNATVQPILPAISLSLVLSQLVKPPFNNSFITFSHHPKFHTLDPSIGLVDMVWNMSHADWEMNTDLNAVFLDLILPLALEHQVKQDDMIKRLFIFSDMQFDDGVARSEGTDWETNHDTIQKAYQAAGYEMPQIVYWNLCRTGGITTPVTSDRNGVALMGGFSPGMLKVFMDDVVDEEAVVVAKVGETPIAKVVEAFDPVTVMKKALGMKSYEGLVVVD